MPSTTALPICSAVSPAQNAPALFVTGTTGTLQWQKGTSATGPWTAIANATNATLTLNGVCTTGASAGLAVRHPAAFDQVIEVFVLEILQLT